MKTTETWPVQSTEPATPGDLLTRYALPLIAIGPVAGFIGGQLPWVGNGLVAGLIMAIVQFVLGVIGVIVLALIADFLAPKFGGEASRTNAFKLAVYGMTAAWLAGIFSISPLLGILGLLGLYSVYLVFTGVTPIMKVPQDKAVGYTAVTFIVAFLISVAAASIGTAVTVGVMGVAALTGSSSANESSEEITHP